MRDSHFSARMQAIKAMQFLLLWVITNMLSVAVADNSPPIDGTPKIMTERMVRLKAARDAQAAADKKRKEAANARGPRVAMFHPELRKFDANRNGFLEPEEIAAYRADFAARKVEAAKR